MTRIQTITSFVDLDDMSLLEYRAVDASWARALAYAEQGAVLAGGRGERAPNRDTAIRPARFQPAAC